MAQRGTPIPGWLVHVIKRVRRACSVRKTAREAGVATNTVLKYQDKPQKAG